MKGRAPPVPSLVSQMTEAHAHHDLDGATCCTLDSEAPHFARGSQCQKSPSRRD